MPNININTRYCSGCHQIYAHEDIPEDGKIRIPLLMSLSKGTVRHNPAFIEGYCNECKHQEGKQGD